MSKYDDIIDMPNFEPKNHKRMSMKNRAAQFSPYDALTGYDENVIEAGRITYKKKKLSNDEEEILNMKLQLVEEHINDNLPLKVLYFKDDNKKDGGKYIEYKGIVRKIDLYNKEIIFKDKFRIKIDDILDLKAEYLNKLGLEAEN